MLEISHNQTLFLCPCGDLVPIQEYIYTRKLQGHKSNNRCPWPRNSGHMCQDEDNADECEPMRFSQKGAWPFVRITNIKYVCYHWLLLAHGQTLLIIHDSLSY